jgi:hypothetical protein
VDISEVFVPAARAGPLTWGSPTGSVRAGWRRRVRRDEASFDAVACIGATWIGGRLVTPCALGSTVVPGGLLLIGEPFGGRPRPGGHPPT